MAHVRRERLSVDARGDHVAGERVPRLMERDPLELRRLPGVVSLPHGRSRVEWHRGCLAKHKALSASLPHPVFDQEVPQYARDRHLALALDALGLDEALMRVPGTLYAN